MFINGEISPVTGFAVNPMASFATGSPVELPVETGGTGDMGLALGVPPYLGQAPSGDADLKRFYGMHYLIIPEAAGLIPDVPAVMRRLHQDPLRPLSPTEIL